MLIHLSIMRTAFFAVLLITLSIAASPSMADTAVTTARLTVRAGPHASLPAVAIIRRGDSVDLKGCLRSTEWCEIETVNDERGFVPASYLRVDRRGRSLTIIEWKAGGGSRTIIFRPHNYWDRYYSEKPFYKDRDRWFGHKPEGDGMFDDDDVPPKPPKEKPVKADKPDPKYGPAKLGNDKYNPLCPFGQTSC